MRAFIKKTTAMDSNPYHPNRQLSILTIKLSRQNPLSRVEPTSYPL